MGGHVSNIYFGLSPMPVATGLLAVTYAIIMSEKVNRAIVAQSEPEVMSGASWFWWIAGLSLVNSIMTHSGSDTGFIIGLGFTLVVFNNGASGYVKALQHLMYGKDAYQSSDLAEMNYAKVAQAMGCTGIRVEKPDDLKAAFKTGIAARSGAKGSVPVVIDVVVTRDPAKMLPAVDNRTVQVKKGDRVA